MCDMIKITVEENQGNQRLDRFLKKYFAKAPLSHIYRMIRKDVRVNGRRKTPETVIIPGDEITVYVSDEQAAKFRRDVRRPSARRTFSVIYEDDNIIVVSKPFGLLTHGDGKEQKRSSRQPGSSLSDRKRRLRPGFRSDPLPLLPQTGWTGTPRDL